MNNEEAAARLKRLSAYAASDPANVALAVEAAELALKLGKIGEATALIERSLRSRPGDSQLMFQLGTCLLASGDFAEAASQYEALIQAASSHPAVRYNLAYAQQGMGDFAGAAETLSELDAGGWDQVPDAHRLFARSCHHLERYDEGAGHLKQYLMIRPDDAAAWGELALIEFDRDDSDGARAAAARAFALDAGDVNAHLALGGLALEAQDAGEADQQFSDAIERHATNGRAWSGLAFARMLKVDMAGAKDAFLRAVKTMPDHIGTWHGLGWLQLLEGDLDGAQQSFDKAMAIDRNFGETHGGLAVIAAIRGQDDDAEKMIRRALGLNPQSFSARYAKSLLLQRKGDRASSEEMVRGILSSAAPGGLEAFRGMIAKVAQAAGPARGGMPRKKRGH